MTAREFAAANGLNVKTLENWKYRLGLKLRRQPELANRSDMVRPGFVQVDPSGNHLRVTPVASPRSQPTDISACEPFELQLRNGLAVKVPPRFDVDGLRRLLAALETR